MCGIAGYIGYQELSDRSVTACLERMRRRGPDAQGVYRHVFRDRHVCLLHSRLSIIDLDKRANQPFKRGAKVLVSNGELYNYLELKADLKAKGCPFDTESDTEVLIAALDHYGWQKGLDQCEGMWAFALYDEADGSLLLCRDRFSEKPLYLFEDETGLYFASEVKFLAALTGRRFEVNHNHLYRYLVNGYRALYKVNETFFKGVGELAPATVRLIDAQGNTTKQKYWLPTFEQDAQMTREEAIEGVREKLIRAVKLRLRADVPLAFCMSGGVDSNALISIAKRVFQYDVHGFTIIDADERYDEQDMVDSSVNDLGIRHTAIRTNPDDFLPRLRRLVAYHDAPVSTISYYAHWLLMESIGAHGYHISVSGTGADELLTGYYDHHNMFLYEILQDRSLFDTSLAHWNTHIAPIVRNPYLQDPQVFIKNPHERRHIYLDAEQFAAFLDTPFHEPFTERSFCPQLLRNRMLNELFEEVVPVILHDDDLNAMYFSIENRSPFLDRSLFEFCSRIPTRHLIRNGYNKAVLRAAMQGIVPENILQCRRKVGFNAPIFSFLDVTDQQVRDYLLDGGPIFSHIRKDAIEDLIAKSSLPNSESKFLFYFVCAKMFLEEFAA